MARQRGGINRRRYWYLIPANGHGILTTGVKCAALGAVILNWEFRPLSIARHAGLPALDPLQAQHLTAPWYRGAWAF